MGNDSFVNLNSSYEFDENNSFHLKQEEIEN